MNNQNKKRKKTCVDCDYNDTYYYIRDLHLTNCPDLKELLSIMRYIGWIGLIRLVFSKKKIKYFENEYIRMGIKFLGDGVFIQDWEYLQNKGVK